MYDGNALKNRQEQETDAVMSDLDYILGSMFKRGTSDNLAMLFRKGCGQKHEGTASGRAWLLIVKRGLF